MDYIVPARQVKALRRSIHDLFHGDEFPGADAAEKLPLYVYDPLDETEGHIRYLLLLPGERRDPIKLHLTTAPLTGNGSVSFEALSYVWGSKEDMIPVAVKSVKSVAEDLVETIFYEPATPESPHDHDSVMSINSFSKIYITQNLRRALPYLRNVDVPRRLWIDGLCINQADVDERSKQVLVCLDYR